VFVPGREPEAAFRTVGAQGHPARRRSGRQHLDLANLDVVGECRDAFLGLRDGFDHHLGVSRELRVVSRAYRDVLPAARVEDRPIVGHGPVVADLRDPLRADRHVGYLHVPAAGRETGALVIVVRATQAHGLEADVVWVPAPVARGFPARELLLRVSAASRAVRACEALLVQWVQVLNHRPGRPNRPGLFSEAAEVGQELVAVPEVRCWARVLGELRLGALLRE
jgi:hypothetical protein